MQIKRAKKILPKKEFEQFESLIANQHSMIQSRHLKQKVTSARRLRQKYRDIARRQAVGVRHRRTNVTDVGLITAKADLFDQLIERIEQVLADRSE